MCVYDWDRCKIMPTTKGEKELVKRARAEQRLAAKIKKEIKRVESIMTAAPEPTPAPKLVCNMTDAMT